MTLPQHAHSVRNWPSRLLWSIYIAGYEPNTPHTCTHARTLVPHTTHHTPHHMPHAKSRLRQGRRAEARIHFTWRYAWLVLLLRDHGSLLFIRRGSSQPCRYTIGCCHGATCRGGRRCNQNHPTPNRRNSPARSAASVQPGHKRGLQRHRQDICALGMLSSDRKVADFERIVNNTLSTAHPQC